MAEKLTLTWIGHSCFQLECGTYTIVFDPYEDGYVPGCPPVRVCADLVLCSHDHKDHGASHLVQRIEDAGRENPFRVEVLHTWHDDQRGALRGPDKIHILDDGTFRIAHLGDLGCELTDSEVEQLRNLDLLLVPVGGCYTIDARQAKHLVERLCPRLVVPIHYRGENFGFDVLAPVKDYTDLCSHTVFSQCEVLRLEKQGDDMRWTTGNEIGSLIVGKEQNEPTTIVLRMANQ